MHPLFETQELVSAICASLLAEYQLEWGVYRPPWHELGPFRRTALVSMGFFYATLPYIWERVNVLDLFRRGLIPAEVSSGPEHKTRIPDSISREILSRFHFYAPYIKTLKVPSVQIMTEIHNWKSLIVYSEDKQLLPNLIEFKCEGFHLQALSVFLPHSTRKFVLEIPVCSKQLAISSIRQTLEHVAHKCPDLYSLEFYSCLTVDVSPSIQALSCFKHLGHLVSTPIVLHSTALQQVAQLPRLNTLSIEPYDRTHWNSSLCQPVPVGGFPALNDLKIYLKNPRDVSRFWELIPLGILGKLDLTIHGASKDESEFIPTLCRASPQITELALGFTASRGRSAWFYKISADTFEHLARLPIVSCSFRSAKLDFQGAWARVATSWPNLRSIQCFHQPTELEDLSFLSSNLPGLENIGCLFDLEQAACVVGADWSPVGRPPFYPGLRNLTSSRTNIMKIADAPELRGLARLFAYFWPRMSVKSVEQYFWEETDREAPGGLAELSARKEASFSMLKQLILAHVELYHKT